MLMAMFFANLACVFMLDMPPVFRMVNFGVAVLCLFGALVMESHNE